MRDVAVSDAIPKLNRQLVRLMVISATVFFAALALYLNVSREGVTAKFVATPVAAIAMGVFGATVIRQWQHTKGRGRIIVAGVAVAFIAVWLTLVLGK